MSPAAYLLKSEILFNSKISDANRGARFLSCDMKDFFLETPITRAYYMIIQSKYFPPDIIALYHIYGLIEEYGYFYINIVKACTAEKSQP